MSETFHSCPGCQSLILSDTPSCPECGHIFKAGGDVAAPITHERGATVHQRCPKCGDEVPAGLVRCWSCNTFMREDVAEKYQALVDNPQKIIFSDVPPGERTETIPPRAGRGGYARILDADDEDEFTLQGEDSAAPEFELSTDAPESKAAAPTPAAEPQTAEPQPAESAATSSDSPAGSAPPADQEATADEGSAAKAEETAAPATPGDANADDLLNIALTQEKEADVRKQLRKAAMNRKRILIPCPSCGVWLRVREEQAGRSVRCRSCQTAVPVPAIKKKEKKAKKEKAPELVLDWLEDLHVHLIVPTDITLKPGSLSDTYQTADAVFVDDGLHLILMGGPPKKKSLFSRGSTDDIPQKRRDIREQIKASGSFENLPDVDAYLVPTDALQSIRLVQPVRQAHESMFAGVPVFGEGRIVVYLPISLEDGQQLYCSMALSLWRLFHAQLKETGISLPDRENGVPQSEVIISPLCHYTQAKVEAIRDVTYYQNDSAFELELSGYRCAACGIAVSESARAKNKLGGAAGKSIAKAKCPKCSAKFGNEPLHRLARAPESEDGEEDTAAGSDS